MPQYPYVRLSSFYFFYFASLGALIPYWGPYLKSLGFDALQIGELMAILMVTKTFGPYFWAWIGDHTGQRVATVRIASLLAAVCFAAMFLAEGFWGIGLVMVCYSFFWNAALPQLEAVTFNHLGRQTERYALVRVWGSIGFILAVALLGAMIDSHGAGLVLPVVLSLFVAIWISTWVIPDHGGASTGVEQQASVVQRLRDPAVMALIVSAFLMQAGHGAYYAFFSIYMKQVGYSSSAIGQLWALGVFAEVVLFMFMHRLLGRFGARYMLLLSMLLGVLRWFLTGWFADQLWLLLLAQILHAATFGIFHVAAIDLVHRYFPGRIQGRGQALYSSASFGAGGAVGSLLSGILWDDGGALLTYSLSALVVALGWLIAWRWLREEPVRPVADP